MRGYPQVPFRIPVTLVKIYFSHVHYKPPKKLSVLAGTTLRTVPTKYFFVIYDYAGKADLSKGY